MMFISLIYFNANLNCTISTPAQVKISKRNFFVFEGGFSME